MYTLRSITPMLQTAITEHEPIMLIGNPGIGKTDITKHVATACGYEYMSVSAALCDPTDAQGIYVPTQDGVQQYPAPYLSPLLSDAKIVMVIDDIGQAAPETQKSFMRLIHERRVGPRSVGDHVAFLAATNEVDGRTGVYPLLSPLLSRFAAILHVTADARSWETWAWENNLDHRIIGYVHAHPDAIDDYNTDLPPMQPWCCPRTLHAVSRWLGYGVDDVEIWAGAIGRGRALELQAYCSVAGNIPDAERILAGGKIPGPIDKRIAITSAIIALADAKNAEMVCRYFDRIGGELAAWAAQSVLIRFPEFDETAAFRAWANRNQKML